MAARPYATVARWSRPWRAKRRWKSHLGDEVDYWATWLRDHGGPFPAEFQRRLDPGALVDEEPIVSAIEGFRTGSARILDVGAGPLTSLGKVLDGQRLEIVPVDPLADRYDVLLEAERITPPIRTLRCRGEELVERFGPESFDIAYARNSLDHSADPFLILKNMLTVTRRGGVVVTRHRRNEAEAECYVGLHQWNFDIRDGAFVLWSGSTEIDVSEHFAGQATVDMAVDGYCVVCLLQKL